MNKIININGKLSPFFKLFSTILVEDEINTKNIFYKTSESSLFKDTKRIKFNFYEGNLENSIFDYKSMGEAKVKINKTKKLIKILRFSPTLSIVESNLKDFHDVKYKCRSLILDYLQEYTNNLGEKYYFKIRDLDDFEFFKVKTDLNQKKISLDDYISKF